MNCISYIYDICLKWCHQVEGWNFLFMFLKTIYILYVWWIVYLTFMIYVWNDATRWRAEFLFRFLIDFLFCICDELYISYLWYMFEMMPPGGRLADNTSNIGFFRGLAVDILKSSSFSFSLFGGRGSSGPRAQTK